MFHYVFILRCKDGRFFTGITTDLAREMDYHQKGINKKCYTYPRRPVILEWYQTFSNYQQAMAIKRKLSGWSGQKKAAFLEKTSITYKR